MKATTKAGPIIVCLFVTLTLVPLLLGAQSRERRTYGAGAPEAKLMLYYSSTVAFSSVGAPLEDRRIEAAVEISYLPPLSAEQRTAGSDKPESTNLAPVFARPRIAVALPRRFTLEVSWIPPVRVFDVKANLISGALSRSFSLAPSVRLVPRASFLRGRVEGPITCNRETATTSGAALATYFAFVCYGNDSRDYFEPTHVSAELLLAHQSLSSRLQPYVSAGARAERTRFDIGVIRQDGTRDGDQPVLEVKTTRAYGTAGASWLGIPRSRLAAELYYAPGSAFTARALAGVRLW